MNAKTQGLIAALLAAVLIKLAWTGQYLRFVLPWMRWPILLAGAVLLVMAFRPALGLARSHEKVPWPSWLLVLPTLVVLAVAPPPLGAFLAERRANQPPPRPSDPIVLTADAGTPLTVGLDELVWGAAQPDDAMGLAGHTIRVEGFVSRDPAGHWYVTQMVIFCCAADAIAERARVVGPPSPPRDQWVRITGTWVQGTGAHFKAPPAIRADKVVPIRTPKDPYG